MRTSTFTQWWESLNWGTVPDWFVAAGTLAAFLIAAIAYLWNVRTSWASEARRVSTADLETRHVAEGNSVPTELNVKWTTARVSQNSRGEAVITASCDSLLITSTVYNGSDELMGPVEISIIDVTNNRLITDATFPVRGIQPKTEHTASVCLRDSWNGAIPVFAVRIVFRDSAGRWWSRIDTAPVTRAHRRSVPSYADPEKLKHFSNAKAWIPAIEGRSSD